jgi:hypothetical protein
MIALFQANPGRLRHRKLAVLPVADSFSAEQSPNNHKGMMTIEAPEFLRRFLLLPRSWNSRGSVDLPSTASRSSSWSKMAAGMVYRNSRQLASLIGSRARAQP